MQDATIICLANSFKHGGRCVAGLRLDTGKWVRPVSDELEGVLNANHYTLSNGREAALLDVLTMPLKCPHPEPHHPENWLIDFDPWRKNKSPSQSELRELLHQSLSPGPELLGDKEHRISFESILQHPMSESLALVKPENLACRIEESLYSRKRRIRILFTLANAEYELPLTDPLWLKRLEKFPVGCHPWEKNGPEALLTISLGEPYSKDGYCYKLVAAVVVLPATSASKRLLEGIKTYCHIIWDWTSGRVGRRRS